MCTGTATHTEDGVVYKTTIQRLINSGSMFNNKKKTLSTTVISLLCTLEPEKPYSAHLHAVGPIIKAPKSVHTPNYIFSQFANK